MPWFHCQVRDADVISCSLLYISHAAYWISNFHSMCALQQQNCTCVHYSIMYTSTNTHKSSALVNMRDSEHRWVRISLNWKVTYFRRAFHCSAPYIAWCAYLCIHGYKYGCCQAYKIIYVLSQWNLSSLVTTHKNPGATILGISYVHVTRCPDGMSPKGALEFVASAFSNLKLPIEYMPKNISLGRERWSRSLVWFVFEY